MKTKSPGAKVQRAAGTLRPCNGCKRSTRVVFPFDRTMNACHDCTLENGPGHLRLLSHSTCKKKLMLDDRDLSVCPVFHTLHRSYHNIIRLYRWQDVLAALLDKYGGPSRLNDAVSSLRSKQWKRGGARRLRTDLATRLMNKNDPAGVHSRALMHATCCLDYVKNGIGGQKRVQERIRRHTSFESASSHRTGDLALVLANARRMYVRGGAEYYFKVAPRASTLYQDPGELATTATKSELEDYLIYGHISLHDVCVTIVAQDNGRRELTDALSERGLELQKLHSCPCNEYIQIGAGNVDKIVDDLDEMRF
jgi:hypothetical protein